MRLTCPNCGAQYEVPDDVIPTEGRDVQCSNCGDTWYQVHAEAVSSEPEQEDQHQAELDDSENPDEYFDDDEDGTGWDDEEEDSAEHEVPPDEETGRGLDSSISDILREEAEREAQLRAAESGQDGLESQPDLGLDGAMDDEQTRRARQAQDRMARIRGEDPSKAALAEAGSRRGLLPDIEEINSTLRASSNAEAGADAAPQEPAAAPPRKKGGFSRGFALIVLFAVILGLIYANAPKIAETVPQADPMLSAYVALVDQGRVWLDAQVKVFLPQ
jgi:predicted Zn finger-like uncharacterized protein